ncbi:hypothetical protein MTO96_014602 [Rhipicephalus appendiculatus]
MGGDRSTEGVGWTEVDSATDNATRDLINATSPGETMPIAPLEELTAENRELASSNADWTTRTSSRWGVD